MNQLFNLLQPTNYVGQIKIICLKNGLQNIT